MFSHVVWPPRERGTTWSKVSSSGWKRWPQYWQPRRSRRNTLNRVKAGRFAGGTYSFSEMTLGSRNSQLGEWMQRSYSASRSEEHTSELQSLMSISYAVFCLKKKSTNSFV